MVLFIVSAACSAYGAETDTSYGDYRVKEKEKNRGNGGGGCGPRCRSEGNDTASCLSGCFDNCFQTGFEVLRDMINGAIKGIGNSVTSGYDPVPGEKGFDQFAKPNFRYALGAGLGVLDYPGLSTGFQIKAFNQFYFLPSHPVDFRATVGFDFSINSINADFERNVFVNNVRIGTQTIATSSYANVAVPLLAELVIRPSGMNGSFHFIIGSGACVVYEQIKGLKTASYNQEKKDTACSAYHIRPALSLGLGWLTAPGKKFGNIELYYRTCFGRLDRREPLPGGNTSNSHSITIDFSIIF
jgi:hypothetical protein